MSSEFREKLKDKAKKIRRWATRRHIEQDGYHVEPWYDSGSAQNTEWQGKEVLTLDQYNKQYSHDDTQIADKFYAPYNGEVWKHIYDQTGWVEDALLKFGHGNPSALEELIRKVQPIAMYLKAEKSWTTKQEFDKETFPFKSDVGLEGEFGEGELLGDILLQSAMDELNNFDGATANAYVTSFGPNGERWDEVLENNYLLAEVLVRSLEAQLAIYVTERESVMNVCDVTLETLWGVNGHGMTGKPSTTLSIVGAIAGAAIGLATGGSGWALVGAGFAVTSGMVALAEAGEEANSGNDKKGSEFKISGGDAMDVLYSCADATAKISEKATEQENDIAESLRKAYDYAVSSDSRRSKFEIALEEGTPTNDFGKRETAADLDSLVRAATQLFPASADRVLTTNELLADSGGDNMTAFVDENTGGSAMISSSWIALRDLIQDLTAANGSKISRAGEYLFEFAKEAGHLDDKSAEEMDAAARDLDHDAKSSGRDHKPWDY